MAQNAVHVLLLLSVPLVVQSISKYKDPPLEHTKCSITWQKIGCFHDPVVPPSLRPLPEELVNDRDKYSLVNDGHLLRWGEWEDSLHSLACRCANYTRLKGYTMFGLQFYGECWSGKDAEERYSKEGTSEQCLMDYDQDCDKQADHVCVGKAHTNYIYRLTPLLVAASEGISDSEKNAIDGKFSIWGDWGECSVTCGTGSRSRDRTCTNPAPQNGGADCQGSSSETETCEKPPCPIDGRFSVWEGWGGCSVTCGNGTQSRDRTCTNPAPQNGGADCQGDSSQTRTCNKLPCPINGKFSVWGNWGECSVKCGTGTQSRGRTCTNPAPQYGGADCQGDASRTRICNRPPCPIDGKFSAWGDWGECSVTCGSGIQSRGRTCTNPAPQNGGTECQGDSSHTKTCDRPSCPVAVDGTWSRWSPYGKCQLIKKRKKCYNLRSRTKCVQEKKGRRCYKQLRGKPCYDVKQGCTPVYKKTTKKCNKNAGCVVWKDKCVCRNCAIRAKSLLTRQTTVVNGPCENKMICPLTKCPSVWQEWGPCSRTCEGGIQTRYRTLDGAKKTQSRKCNVGECPKHCSTAIDIGVIIDVSGSVGRLNCWRTAGLLKHLVQLYDVNKGGTHFSFITYSSMATMKKVDNKIWSWDPKAIEIMLNRTCEHYLGGGTRTDLALKLAHGVMFGRPSKSRKDKPRVLLTFTDGMTNKKRSEPFRKVVPSLVNQGINMLAVGLGSGTPGVMRHMKYELTQIANEKKENVFQITDWSQLESGLKHITDKVCPSAAVPSIWSNAKRGRYWDDDRFESRNSSKKKYKGRKKSKGKGRKSKKRRNSKSRKKQKQRKYADYYEGYIDMSNRK